MSHYNISLNLEHIDHMFEFAYFNDLNYIIKVPSLIVIEILLSIHPRVFMF